MSHSLTAFKPNFPTYGKSFQVTTYHAIVVVDRLVPTASIPTILATIVNKKFPNFFTKLFKLKTSNDYFIKRGVF